MTAPAGIIWLASFPKSGNTWFRIFLANLTAAEDAPLDINDLNERGDIASSRYEFEAATLLDSGLISHDDIDRLRPRVYERIATEVTEQRWVKVHDAYSITPDGEPVLGRGVARAAVYLVRDPRDVAISLAYHNSSTIDDGIKLMNAADGALCRPRKGMSPQLRQMLQGWSGHVTSWLDQTDMPVHTARYEDLVADPVAGFSAALKFVESEATIAQIERAVRHADFAELQRQEGEKGFAERMSSTEPFFRSGRAGGWRDQLTAEQVARIEEAHAPTMQRLRYELSITPTSAVANEQEAAAASAQTPAG
jgi:aryl sulfotransferase